MLPKLSIDNTNIALSPQLLFDNASPKIAKIANTVVPISSKVHAHPLKLEKALSKKSNSTRTIIADKNNLILPLAINKLV